MGKTNEEWAEVLCKLERDEWPDVVGEIRREGMERAAKMADERAVEALIRLDREGLWDEDTIARAIDAIRAAAKEQS